MMVCSLKKGGFNIWLFRYRKGKWRKERIFSWLLLNLFSSSYFVTLHAVPTFSFVYARCRAATKRHSFYCVKLHLLCVSYLNKAKKKQPTIKIFKRQFCSREFNSPLFLFIRMRQKLCMPRLFPYFRAILIWKSRYEFLSI